MIHTHFLEGMHVRLSFLFLLNSINASIAQGWTGVLDAYFWMTEDPQPGTGTYRQHTHLWLSLFLFSCLFLSLKVGHGVYTYTLG